MTYNAYTNLLGETDFILWGETSCEILMQGSQHQASEKCNSIRILKGHSKQEQKKLDIWQ